MYLNRLDQDQGNAYRNEKKTRSYILLSECPVFRLGECLVVQNAHKRKQLATIEGCVLCTLARTETASFR